MAGHLDCNKPPEGWYCTRGRGHEGPCAAVPRHPETDWPTISMEELKGLGARIDSTLVHAPSLPELYRELNTKYGHEKWTTLRAPQWCGDQLVVMVVKPRDDNDPGPRLNDEEEDDEEARPEE